MSSKKKRAINYKARMQVIRRFVNFDYDLRKPLSAGQKSAITKAYKEIMTYRSRRFVPLPKHKSESDREYKRRIKSTRETAGQTSSRAKLLKGVFVDVPTGFKVRATKKGLRFYAPSFIEEIIPADHEILSQEGGAELEAERVWWGNDFNYIAINYSGHGRSIGFERDSYEDDTLLEDFTNEIRGLSNKYRKVIQYAISSYIIRKLRHG